MKITHAQQRAKERYEIMLTGEVIADIVRQIATRKAILLGNQANGHLRYLVKVGEKAVPIVYAPDGKFIVSVLPRNARAQRVPDDWKPPQSNKFATRRRKAHA